MSAQQKRYRRNFVIAVILHAAVMIAVIFGEHFFNAGSASAKPTVDMIIPAALLGEAPKGEGTGFGAYKPPAEPAGANNIAGPNAEMSPPDETVAPKATLPKSDPNDIAIAKKNATKKPATKPVADAKPTIASAKSKTTAGTSKAASADDIKNRFAKALQAAENGTPYGDGKKAGGGSGKGRVGSPNGTADGEIGGVGQGSPNWKYFEHVHDVMYEAWGETAASLDRKLVATVQLRVARDGTITDVSLRIASGSKTMDESVLSAARKVQRLDPPPDSLVRGDAASITVDFQVEG
jgi:TonB family protein